LGINVPLMEVVEEMHHSVQALEYAHQGIICAKMALVFLDQHNKKVVNLCQRVLSVEYNG
jgi:hypothetical protein